MVKVKICGLTNAEDGFAALRLGADYLGFVVEVEGAARSLSKAEAIPLFEQLKGKAPLVALTSLAKGKEIASLCSSLDADAVQLVANLEEGEAFELHHILPKLKIFKSVQVRGKKSLQEAKRFEKFVNAIVLDAYSKTRMGGTGRKADWKACRSIASQVSRQVFLAGGLNPGNVEDVIMQVKPFGVDVSSGVKKKSNKRKLDLNKLKEFIERAKAA